MHHVMPPSVLLREQEEKKHSMKATQKSTRKRNYVVNGVMTQVQFLSAGCGDQ